MMYSRPIDRTVLKKDENGREIILVSTIDAVDASGTETAISHPAYKDGHVIVVEAYDTYTEAIEGHKKWVKKMDVPFEELPESLTDNGRAVIRDLARLVGLSDEDDFTYERDDTKRHLHHKE